MTMHTEPFADRKRTPVEYVLAAMAASYGAAWDRSLGQAPINDVKTRWAYAIEPFLHNAAAKRAILWALDNLPERPPNAIQFRALCHQAPAVEAPRLEAPEADPARIARELAKLSEIRQAPAQPTNNDWARRIISNHENGIEVERYKWAWLLSQQTLVPEYRGSKLVSHAALTMAKAALGLND